MAAHDEETAVLGYRDAPASAEVVAGREPGDLIDYLAFCIQQQDRVIWRRFLLIVAAFVLAQGQQCRLDHGRQPDPGDRIRR